MIALLTATWDEIKLLKTDINVFEEGGSGDLTWVLGELYNKNVIVAETGVGIRRARAGASLVIQKFKPEIIIVLGIGGALSDDLKVGDLVLGNNVMSLKKNETHELHHNLLLQSTNIRKGLILTESRFINEPNEKKKLFNKSGALVVDMETWGVVEAARQSKTPVCSIRAVSDESNEKLPDMAVIYNYNSELDFEKADKYFIDNPDLITPYLKFRFKNTAIASDSLYKFIPHVLSHR